MDVQQVLEEYSRRESVPIEEAKNLLDETVAYLTREAGENPTSAVDKMWHWLILNTKFYAEFCALQFGKFIHHFPSDTSNLLASAECDAGRCGLRCTHCNNVEQAA